MQSKVAESAQINQISKLDKFISKVTFITWADIVATLSIHIKLACCFISNKKIVQFAFNLSNRVTDTLESSTILIYSEEHMGLYTQNLGRTP